MSKDYKELLNTIHTTLQQRLKNNTKQETKTCKSAIVVVRKVSNRIEITLTPVK